jgi:hypothetical protein
MRTHRIFPRILAPALLLLGGCGAVAIKGSGVVVEEQHKPEAFDSIAGHGGLDLEITKADATHQIVVKIDDNLQKYVDVEQDGAHVAIGFYGIPPGRHLEPTEWSADVAMESLTAIDLSGGTHGSFEGFDLADLEINASGGSVLTAVPEQTVTGTVEANGSGGSHFELGHLAIPDLAINLSGGSHCTVRIQDGGTLTANLSGGSRLTYCGTNVQVSEDVSGGSQVTHGDDCG